MAKQSRDVLRSLEMVFEQYERDLSSIKRRLSKIEKGINGESGINDQLAAIRVEQYEHYEELNGKLDKLLGASNHEVDDPARAVNP
jgi:hypothetical protein